MVVPGPGHVDAEQELHRSLLNREASSESDFGTNDSNQNNEQDNRDKVLIQNNLLKIRNKITFNKNSFLPLHRKD